MWTATITKVEQGIGNENNVATVLIENKNTGESRTEIINSNDADFVAAVAKRAQDIIVVLENKAAAITQVSQLNFPYKLTLPRDQK